MMAINYFTDSNFMNQPLQSNNKKQITIVNIFPLIWAQPNSNRDIRAKDSRIANDDFLFTYWNLLHRYNANKKLYYDQYNNIFTKYISMIESGNYEKFALMFFVVYSMIDISDLDHILTKSDYFYCSIDLVSNDPEMTDVYNFPFGTHVRQSYRIINESKPRNTTIYTSVNGYSELHLLFNTQYIEFIDHPEYFNNMEDKFKQFFTYYKNKDIWAVMPVKVGLTSIDNISEEQ